MKITAKTKINMVIGDPVEHSLSPQMHNAGYEALKIADEFVYISCPVDVNNIEKFVNGIRAMNINGVSCTVPHKIAVMPFLDNIDETAKKIGAVNTIKNVNGEFKGYNTDWMGIVVPLEKITSLQNKTIAIIGAGGASRAACYAVTSKGAQLIIFNRTLSKAQQLADDFRGKAFSLDEIEKVTDADIIINTTSVGLTQKDKNPVAKDLIKETQIIFDIVYGAKETQLIKDAKEKGATTISGIEMLLYQGFAQFKLFTGYDAPVDAMRKAIV